MGRGRLSGHYFMKHFLVAIFITLTTFTAAFAQREKTVERIHAAKMAYITDRLHLSQRQAADFIPVYKDYEREVRETRMAFFKKYRGADPADVDDSTSRQLVDDNLDYQQKVIEIKRKYKDQFLKIISPRQFTALNAAEREFKQMLIKRLDHGRGRGGRFNGRRNDGY